MSGDNELQPVPPKASILTVQLPPRIDGAPPEALGLQAGDSLLFLGANGTGKTRLAGWLDRAHGVRSLYIAARRDISMPSSYSILPEEKQFEMIYGQASWGQQQSPDIELIKRHRYASGAAAPFNSNDFQNIMNVIAGRHLSEVQNFRNEYKPDSPPQNIGKTTLEMAIEIWKSLLPDLTIITSKAPTFVVEHRANPGITYEPADMSDGERAIFYLVAKTLLADEGTLIIVDEPETYVHRSLRNRLWDRLEQERAGCIFSYFTHDVDFASSRTFKKKILLERFLPNSKTDKTDGRWQYKEIAEEDALPDEIYITILGARSRTLLVEGRRGSLDATLARALYPAFLIEPVASCGQVIRWTSALNQAKSLHHRSVVGLIDADFRSLAQLEHLLTKDIHSHRLRDIENALSTQESLTAILRNTGRAGAAEAVVSKLVDVICKRLTAQRVQFCNALAKRHAASEFEKLLGGQDESSGSLKDLVASVGLDDIDRTASERIDAAIQSRHLNSLLQLVSIRKDNLQSVIAGALRISDWKALEEMCIGWIKDNKSEAGKALINALSVHFPRLS